MQTHVVRGRAIG